jgi:hypothetical protein
MGDDKIISTDESLNLFSSINPFTGTGICKFLKTDSVIRTSINTSTTSNINFKNSNTRVVVKNTQPNKTLRIELDTSVIYVSTNPGSPMTPMKVSSGYLSFSDSNGLHIGFAVMNPGMPIYLTQSTDDATPVLTETGTIQLNPDDDWYNYITVSQVTAPVNGTGWVKTLNNQYICLDYDTQNISYSTVKKSNSLYIGVYKCPALESQQPGRYLFTAIQGKYGADMKTLTILSFTGSTAPYKPDFFYNAWGLCQNQNYGHCDYVFGNTLFDTVITATVGDSSQLYTLPCFCSRNSCNGYYVNFTFPVNIIFDKISTGNGGDLQLQISVDAFKNERGANVMYTRSSSSPSTAQADSQSLPAVFSVYCNPGTISVFEIQ